MWQTIYVYTHEETATGGNREKSEDRNTPFAFFASWVHIVNNRFPFPFRCTGSSSSLFGLRRTMPIYIHSIYCTGVRVKKSLLFFPLIGCQLLYFYAGMYNMGGKNRIIRTTYYYIYLTELWCTCCVQLGTFSIFIIRAEMHCAVDDPLLFPLVFCTLSVFFLF